MSPRKGTPSPIPYKLVLRRQMGIPAVWCPLCKEWLMLLTHTHARKHGMTQKEFCFKYPEISDIFYWADLPTQQSRAKFRKWKKLAESKKGPPEGRPSNEGQG